MSEPFTLFDSKQLHDNGPLFWDQSITDGSGNATSTHSTTDASVTLHVEAGDTIIRQTKTHWNYQPGKSQLCVFTGNVVDAGGGTISVVVRKGSSDTAIAQANWNGDKLDGTGNSGKTLDPTKAQIMFIDYEWLGVGKVRFGFFVDGLPIVCHSVNNFNQLTSVYMATPTLPVRYEASVAGTTGTARVGSFTATDGLFFQWQGTTTSFDLQHICCAVISEGGLEDRGINTYVSNGATPVDANVAGTIYACVGVRLNSTHLDMMARPIAASMLATTEDDFEWILLVNPTVAGTFTYASITNSGLQVATGATANTVTGGYAIAGGHVAAGTKAGGAFGAEIASEIWLGSKIDGTPDTFVLCVRPHGADADIRGSMVVKELR